MKTDRKCRLAYDEKLIVAPQEKGEPPAWVAVSTCVEVIWVDQELYEQWKSRRYEKPCDICPKEIKGKCALFRSGKE